VVGLIDGEGRVAILYGVSPLPIPPGLDVYLSRPDYAGAHPLVVVVGDAAGTTPSIKAMTRRLSRFGYAALAPDLGRARSVDEALADVVSVARDEWSHWCSADRFVALGLGDGAAAAARLAGAHGGASVLIPRSLDGLAAAVSGSTGPLLVLVGAAGTEELRAARDGAGRGEWVRYGSAQAGFFDDGSPDYDRASAEDAFHRVIAFLDGRLTRVEVS
jgi:dienelactone hydrolase